MSASRRRSRTPWTARVVAEPAREPIEPYLRVEEPPDDAVVVVRGGPIATEKVAEHAHRQSRGYTFGGAPMFSVSASLTVAAWTVDAILAGPMASRATVALSTAGRLRSSGFVLLPTYEVPHYDVVLPSAGYADADRLLECFGPPQPNPYKRRGR